MQGNAQDIAVLMIQAISENRLFCATKSLLEISLIACTLYVIYELGMFALAHAVEKLWPEQEMALLDKIFGAYVKGENGLMIPCVDCEKSTIAWRNFLELPAGRERQLLAYGLKLRINGHSRREVKRALKAVRARLELALMESMSGLPFAYPKRLG